MSDEVLKEKYYNPYVEAWKTIRLVQYADQTSDSDEQWNRYIKEIDRLSNTYPNNPFVDSLITFLLDAGNIIAKENKVDV